MLKDLVDKMSTETFEPRRSIIQKSRKHVKSLLIDRGNPNDDGKPIFASILQGPYGQKRESILNRQSRLFQERLLFFTGNKNAPSGDKGTDACKKCCLTPNGSWAHIPDDWLMFMSTIIDVINTAIITNDIGVIFQLQDSYKGLYSQMLDTLTDFDPSLRFFDTQEPESCMNHIANFTTDLRCNSIVEMENVQLSYKSNKSMQTERWFVPKSDSIIPTVTEGVVQPFPELLDCMMSLPSCTKKTIKVLRVDNSLIDVRKNTNEDDDKDNESDSLSIAALLTTENVVEKEEKLKLLLESEFEYDIPIDPGYNNRKSDEYDDSDYQEFNKIYVESIKKESECSDQMVEEILEEPVVKQSSLKKKESTKVKASFILTDIIELETRAILASQMLSSIMENFYENIRPGVLQMKDVRKNVTQTYHKPRKTRKSLIDKEIVKQSEALYGNANEEKQKNNEERNLNKVGSYSRQKSSIQDESKERIRLLEIQKKNQRQKRQVPKMLKSTENVDNKKKRKSKITDLNKADKKKRSYPKYRCSTKGISAGMTSMGNRRSTLFNKFNNFRESINNKSLLKKRYQIKVKKNSTSIDKKDLEKNYLTNEPCTLPKVKYWYLYNPKIVQASDKPKPSIMLPLTLDINAIVENLRFSQACSKHSKSYFQPIKVYEDMHSNEDVVV